MAARCLIGVMIFGKKNGIDVEIDQGRNGVSSLRPVV